MKYSIPKERILSASHDDAKFDVAAGTPALDPTFGVEGSPFSSAEHGGMEHWAFSRFVQLLRRGKGLSIERLAEKACIEVRELERIECDAQYEPRPRTVHQLAEFFGLPERKLLELSNLTTLHTPQLMEAAVRFAANAKNVLELSKEERQALNEFVTFLSTQ